MVENGYVQTDRRFTAAMPVLRRGFDRWHLAFEVYDEHEDDIPDLKNSQVHALNAALGSDRASPFGLPYISCNNPDEAQCNNTTPVRCNAPATGAVLYINYSPGPLDNISFRPELYWDPQGQRTATAATYWKVSFGWRHWLSPQIEIGPEVGYHLSNGAAAFNAGTKNWTVIGAGDVIWSC